MTLFLPKISRPMLLLGEHYHFPKKDKIELFMRAHHQTLSANQEKIQAVASKLGSAKSQSKADLVHIIKAHQAPVSTFLPVLIDCAKANLWLYEPPARDKMVLSSLGWKI